MCRSPSAICTKISMMQDSSMFVRSSPVPSGSVVLPAGEFLLPMYWIRVLRSPHPQCSITIHNRPFSMTASFMETTCSLRIKPRKYASRVAISNCFSTGTLMAYFFFSTMCSAVYRNADAPRPNFFTTRYVPFLIVCPGFGILSPLSAHAGCAPGRGPALLSMDVNSTAGSVQFRFIVFPSDIRDPGRLRLGKSPAPLYSDCCVVPKSSKTSVNGSRSDDSSSSFFQALINANELLSILPAACIIAAKRRMSSESAPGFWVHFKFRKLFGNSCIAFSCFRKAPSRSSFSEYVSLEP
mmetsp:Transcript_35774/g.60277  ORF Transcript_35774/g.60277 Transcript_35774/m.60277 type:complete len:296 (-) Transcript_35774:379-1266(-)